MTTTIHVKADLYDITWDTPHKGTTLPTAVRVNFKTHDFDGFMHQAIVKDLESRYFVKVLSFSKQNFQYTISTN